MILIVKLSSLGDIIQTLPVVDYLRSRDLSVEIDWVVSKKWAEALELSTPAINIIPFESKNWLDSLKKVREKKYDLLFDLQGNCKSGVISLGARATTKVGFGFKTAREWPNILSTHQRFDPPLNQNIRSFYLSLVQQFFKDQSEAPIGFPNLEKLKMEQVMVCPGARWENKRLSAETWIAFLRQIEEKYGASFLFVWGSPSEEEFCHLLKDHFPTSHVIHERLSIVSWKQRMEQADLLIALDSSALHLCATTSTPSFSIFGPTSSQVFKPPGAQHGHFQASCPYNQRFIKQCPILRYCQTGACMKTIDPEILFQSFEAWRTI